MPSHTNSATGSHAAILGDGNVRMGTPAFVASTTDVVYGVNAVSMIARLAYASARVP